VDITSAVLFTELAPWSSLVQRFGRCNRRGELNDTGGAEICWIDLEQTETCARPYNIEPVDAARQVMTQLADAAPRRLPPALSPPEAKQMIRAGDFEQLFDTDSDLSGYDLDVSPYIRDTDETAVSLFWRQINGEDRVAASRPERDELCSAPLGRNLDIWLKNQPNGKPAPVYVENPNGEDRRRRRKAGWLRLDRAQTRLRPGMVLMLDVAMGGYDPKLGFVGSRSSVPVDPVASAVGVNSADTDLGETYEDDGLTQDGYDIPVPLERHLRHVETLARKIAAGIGLGAEIGVLVRSARWHDVGKAYAPFQELLGRAADSPLLAKSAPGVRPAARPAGLRRYFRHELASALAFLDQHDGEPQADLVAFLIAAHHGKVRMGMRAMPEETAESPEKRIARGIQDGDELLEVRCGGEISAATKLDLSLMEMGEDE
jgi:CRISPR-associated endonuclease/helicase Cas3